MSEEINNKNGDVSNQEYNNNLGNNENVDLPMANEGEMPDMAMENEGESPDLAIDVPPTDNDTEELDMETVENMDLESVVKDERIQKLEKEFPVDWSKVQWDERFPNVLPVLNEQDISVLIVAGITGDTKKKELKEKIEQVKLILMNYHLYKGKKDDFDEKGIEEAKTYLARLQLLARQEGALLTSAEVNYARSRSLAYNLFVLFIAKKRQISPERAYEDVKTKGYYISFLEALFSGGKDTVKDSVLMLAKMSKKQNRYQEVMEALVDGCKNNNITNPVKNSVNNIKHICNSFAKAIEFAKHYCLTQDTEFANGAIAMIGIEMFKTFQENVASADSDGYYRQNIGKFLGFFKPVNQNMIKLDELFKVHVDNENLNKFAKDMIEYCKIKVGKECKGNKISDVFTELENKLKNDNFNFKDFEKMNNIETYSFYFDTFRHFIDRETSKEGEYLGQALFNTIYHNIIINGLYELYKFIRSGASSDPNIQLYEEYVKEWTLEDIDKNLGVTVNYTAVTLIFHALILDMGISLLIMDDPITTPIKDTLDRILNKRYIETAPNINAFLRMDKDNARTVLSQVLLDYTTSILDIWAGYLSQEVPYEQWDLKVNVPFTGKKKSKNNINI